MDGKQVIPGNPLEAPIVALLAPCYTFAQNPGRKVKVSLGRAKYSTTKERALHLALAYMLKTSTRLGDGRIKYESVIVDFALSLTALQPAEGEKPPGKSISQS